ncbi:MarR family winged helix-turn-helix transcriptional regulator [Streptomyces sp. NPDC001070]
MEPRTVAADTDEATGRLADQLLWLTRRLHRAQRRHLEPVGVTPAQARMLRTVAHTLKNGTPPRMADLAERLDVVPRAVTSLTDALEERGMVRRVPDPANRRVVRIELTEEGHGALRRLRQARRAAAEELLAPLDTDQRDALTALLAVLDTAPGRC